MADKWSAMLGELAAYRKRFGNADVSSRDSEHARLGRWVAAQRHKRRKGLLSAARIRGLNSAGMEWSPGDTVWMEMFGQLAEFAKREGHCNIPEQYPPNQRLASWSHNQRYRKRRGDLSAERREKMESIGFQWAIYRGKKRPARREKSIAVVAAEDPVVHVARARKPEERLYRLKQGVYVQFNGEGRLPEPLARFERQNGELPPYIPLPRLEATFYMGEESGGRPLTWSGSGPLPPQVLEYVRENGCLPRHNY
jgi:hypothetical protein